MEATKITLLYAAVIATIMCIDEALRLFFGNRRATVILIAIGILVMIWASAARADCGHFFRKQHVAVVQQVVTPIYAYPQVYYSAGADLQAEALAEKVARLVQQRLAAAEPIQAPVKAPSTAFAKCVACHTGEGAAGGLVLDGSTPVSCHAYFRWGQIAGQGKQVPAKMQALVSAMSPEQKGAINEALLDLVASSAEVVVPKPPVPDEGLE